MSKWDRSLESKLRLFSDAQSSKIFFGRIVKMKRDYILQKANSSDTQPELWY